MFMWIWLEHIFANSPWIVFTLYLFQEFYGSNVLLILKSKKNIEWTIDTSGMDGNVLVVVSAFMSRDPL